MVNIDENWECPICGKNSEGHYFNFDGDGLKLVCPSSITVDEPLAYCLIDGLEVKHG